MEDTWTWYDQELHRLKQEVIPLEKREVQIKQIDELKEKISRLKREPDELYLYIVKIIIVKSGEDIKFNTYTCYKFNDALKYIIEHIRGDIDGRMREESKLKGEEESSYVFSGLYFDSCKLRRKFYTYEKSIEDQDEGHPYIDVVIGSTKFSFQIVKGIV